MHNMNKVTINIAFKDITAHSMNISLFIVFIEDLWYNFYKGEGLSPHSLSGKYL